MKCKKFITIIIATMLILLPMMTTTIQAAVGRVYNLTAQQNGVSVKFTWSEVSGADGYNLYINTSNKGYEFVGSVRSNQASVIGFNANETYKAKVCAYQQKSNGEKVEGTFAEVAVTYTSKPQVISLPKVKNLEVSQSDQYIKLNWTEVKDATGYQIYVNMPGFGNVNLGSVRSNNAFIKGGAVGETYEFKVRAYKSTNGSFVYGELSDAATLTIKNNQYEELELSRATGVIAKNITTTTAYVEWNKVKNATGYEVWLAKENGNYNKIKQTRNTYVNIKGLDSDTTYKVIIVAYNDEGSKTIYAKDSVVEKFTTQREQVNNIRGFYVEVKHKNEAYLSWWKNDDADGYEVWLSKDGGSFVKQSKDATDSSYILYDLDYRTDYDVKVRAFRYRYGVKEYGNFSAIKSFTTERYDRYEDSPYVAKVTGVSYYVVKDSVFLSWNKVPNAAGYEIEFTVPGLGGVTKLYSNTNSREISGLTEKYYKYTARIRAYRIINGAYEYGQYSEIQKFSGK